MMVVISATLKFKWSTFPILQLSLQNAMYHLLNGPALMLTNKANTLGKSTYHTGKQNLNFGIDNTLRTIQTQGCCNEEMLCKSKKLRTTLSNQKRSHHPTFMSFICATPNKSFHFYVVSISLSSLGASAFSLQRNTIVVPLGNSMLQSALGHL
jgi:hypothetical protein